MPRAVNTFDQRMLEKADSYSSMTAAQFSPNLGLNNFIPSGDTFPTQPNNIITSGLVLYLDAAINNSYPQSGTTWYDLSGNNYHGTLTNGPVFSNENGGVIVFDGSNDYVSLPTFTPASSLGITINVWANFTTIPSTSPSYPRLIELKEFSGWGGSPNMFILLAFQTTNDITFASYSPGVPNASQANLAGAATINSWKMYTGVANSSTIKVYSNGALLASFINFNLPSNVSMSSNFIGRTNDPAAAYLNGKISSVSVYNRLLSDSEILQNYNATKSRFGL
jgi:hypothetical protein